jgi:hypothetical protein
MNSRHVWPQLGTQAAGVHAASQPLLQPACEGCVRCCEGTFEPLVLGALAMPPQLRMSDGQDACTLHTGFSTGKRHETEWEDKPTKSDRDERNCCSMHTVRYAFCDCDPCLCFNNIVHFIF